MDWLASRLNFQASSTSWFQPVYILCSCCQQGSSSWGGKKKTVQESGLYLYLSGNCEFSGSAVWQISNLNCYQFPSPTAILCSYIFTFPNHYLLSQAFESQRKPGRLKQKPFPSKDRALYCCSTLKVSLCQLSTACVETL